MSGSSKEKQSQTTNSQTSPWAPQANQLVHGFNLAFDKLGQADANMPSDFVAGFRPEQLDVYRRMIGYGSDTSVPDANKATGDALAAGGTAGGLGALSRLLSFDPGDGTDTNIANAMKYSDNPAISGMVDAAMRDADRTARETTLPGIERAAQQSGNINNSRRAIIEGMVDRGLAEKRADISANLRGAAYDKGLDLSAADRSLGVTSTIEALTRAGGLGGSFASTGIGARSGTIADMASLLGLSGTGAEGLRAGDQAALDNNIARNSATFDNLMRYMQIVGGNNWGGTTSGTTTGEKTSTPSAWQVAGGLLGAGGQAAGGIAKLATLSDRRVKKNVKLIGKLFDGQPVYRFEYIGSDKVHIGLMAQDVENTCPEAVCEIAGIKAVDYGMATQHI